GDKHVDLGQQVTHRLADCAGLGETASDRKVVSREIFEHVLLEGIGKVTHHGRRGGKNVSNTPDLLRHLRLGAGWPRPRGAEQRDELASANHSITSSARASSLSGTSRPSVLAVLRLITSSYFVGACTGSSAGFSPFRMRSTYDPARRKRSGRSTPYEMRPPA